MKQVIISLSILLLASIVSFGQNFHFSQGKEYQSIGWDESAFNEWVTGMNAGEESSAQMVILCYLNEYGTPRNVQKAIDIINAWYEKSEAICRLGAYFWDATESGAVDYSGKNWIAVNNSYFFYHYAQRYGLEPDYEKAFMFASYVESQYEPASKENRKARNVNRIILSHLYHYGLGGAPTELKKAVNYWSNITEYTNEIYYTGVGKEWEYNKESMVGPWAIACEIVENADGIESFNGCLGTICSLGITSYSEKELLEHIRDVSKYDPYSDFKSFRRFVDIYNKKNEELKAAQEKLVAESIADFSNVIETADWSGFIDSYVSLPPFVKESNKLNPILKSFISSHVNDWKGWGEKVSELPDSSRQQIIDTWLATNMDADKSRFDEAPSSFKSMMEDYFRRLVSNDNSVTLDEAFDIAPIAWKFSDDNETKRSASYWWTYYKIENLSVADAVNMDEILSNPMFYVDSSDRLQQKVNEMTKREQEQRNLRESALLDSFNRNIKEKWPEELLQQLDRDNVEFEKVRNECYQAFSPRIGLLLASLNDIEKEYSLAGESEYAKAIEKELPLYQDFLAIVKSEKNDSITPDVYEAFQKSHPDRYVSYMNDGYAIARMKQLTGESTKQDIKAVRSLPMSKAAAAIVKAGTGKSALN